MPNAPFDGRHLRRRKHTGFASRVRELVPISELKYTTTLVDGVFDDDATFIRFMFLIAQGTGSDERVGNRVMLRRLRLRMISCNTGVVPYKTRRLVYQQINGDAVQVSALPTVVTIVDPYLFNVKKDQMGFMSHLFKGSTDGYFSFEQEMNQLVVYDGPNVNDIVSGWWYFQHRSSVPIGVNDMPVTIQMEAWYRDA